MVEWGHRVAVACPPPTGRKTSLARYCVCANGVSLLSKEQVSYSTLDLNYSSPVEQLSSEIPVPVGC